MAGGNQWVAYMYNSFRSFIAEIVVGNDVDQR